MSSIIRATTTSGLQVAPDNSGSLVLQTNGTTTALTIDTSQNITTAGNIRLNNGAADGAQVTFASSGYSDWNIDNYSGNLRAYYNATEYFRIDSSGNLQCNSGYGSVATAYGCRAWVNFNGTGTVAIRASGNVTSITDNGVGTYTVNLTNAMPDANYSVSSISDDNSANNPQIITYRSATTSTLLLGVWQSAVGRADPVNCCVAIFR